MYSFTTFLQLVIVFDCHPSHSPVLPLPSSSLSGTSTNRPSSPSIFHENVTKSGNMSLAWHSTLILPLRWCWMLGRWSLSVFWLHCHWNQLCGGKLFNYMEILDEISLKGKRNLLFILQYVATLSKSLDNLQWQPAKSWIKVQLWYFKYLSRCQSLKLL